MIGEVELLVLGAGPAGIGAAVNASSIGVDTLIVDESPAPGGQVYRAPPSSFRGKTGSPMGPDHKIGEKLRKELKESRARKAFGMRVWSVAPGFRVEAIGPSGPQNWLAKAIVLATGTYEKIIPFPGWTCPGVIGLGAATVLLKSQQLIPGERTVVAGCGPLVTAVAAGIIKGGGKVAAMVDLLGTGDWLTAIPALASRPNLMLQGMGWLRTIQKTGVPILRRHAVTEVRGNESVSEIVVKPVDSNWRSGTGATERTIQADSLAIGHGFIPDTEITGLLRARHEFHEARGGWVPFRDTDFRSSIDGVYIAGDGAGILGASAATVQGRISGLTVALDLGKITKNDFLKATGKLRKSLAGAEKFGSAVSRLMTLRAGLLDGMASETVVCRCEDVTRREIEEAISKGARDVNQLKAWTRCGMGPCQGRMCGESVGELVAAQVGDRVKAGKWTSRIPIRPVPLEYIVGEYEYADIPVPEPAPV